MVVLSKWIENRRAELVYSPAIIRRFGGCWDGSMRSRMLAEELAGSDFVSQTRLCSELLAVIIAMLVGAVAGFLMSGVGSMILGGIGGLTVALLVRMNIRNSFYRHKEAEGFVLSDFVRSRRI